MPVLQGVLDETHDHASSLPAVLAKAAMSGGAHKDEAQKAIQHVLNMLGRAEPLVGLEREIAKSTLSYARSHVTAIEEKRRLA